MKNIAVVLFCAIVAICAAAVQSCGGETQSQTTVYTVTVPADTQNYTVHFTGALAGEPTQNEDGTQTANYLEGGKVSIMVKFSSNYLSVYDLSEFSIYVDGNLLAAQNINTDSSGNSEIIIADNLSANLNVTFDSSKVKEKITALPLQFELKNMQLAIADNSASEGRKFANLTGETTDKELIDNWHIAYKITSPDNLSDTSGWTQVDLSSINKDNLKSEAAVNVPNNLGLSGDENGKLLFLKVRYGDKNIFDLTKDNSLSGSRTVESDNVSPYMTGNEYYYDSEGYIVYKIDAYLRQGQQNINIKFTSPNYRIKFEAEFSQNARLLTLVKNTFKDEDIYNKSAISSNTIWIGSTTGYVNFFLGQEYKFKAVASYNDSELIKKDGSVLFFDELADYSAAKLLCGGVEITKDAENVYTCTFSDEMLKDGKFSFMVTGVTAKKGAKVVRFSTNSNFTFAFNHIYDLTDGDNSAWQIGLNRPIFPYLENGNYIMPENFIMTGLAYTEQPSGSPEQKLLTAETLKIKINGTEIKSYAYNSDELTVSSGQKTFQYSIDLSEVSYPEGQDYILIEVMEEI